MSKWRRQWQPTPVHLPGKSHGWRSLVGFSPWSHKESDMTERLHFDFSLSCTGEGNGNPLQCSCLENPRDRGAWWAAVYGVAQSWTWLKWLSSSRCSKNYLEWRWIKSNMLWNVYIRQRIKNLREFYPGDPGVKTVHSVQEVWVRSLAGELTYHKQHGQHRQKQKPEEGQQGTRKFKVTSLTLRTFHDGAFMWHNNRWPEPEGAEEKWGVRTQPMRSGTGFCFFFLGLCQRLIIRLPTETL